MINFWSKFLGLIPDEKGRSISRKKRISSKLRSNLPTQNLSEFFCNKTSIPHDERFFSSFYYVFKHDYKASMYSFPGGYWIELVPKSYCENNSNKKERSSLKNYCYFSCAFGWIRFKEIVFAEQTLLLKKKRLIGNSKVRYRNRNQFEINMMRSW